MALGRLFNNPARDPKWWENMKKGAAAQQPPSSGWEAFSTPAQPQSPIATMTEFETPQLGLPGNPWATTPQNPNAAPWQPAPLTPYEQQTVQDIQTTVGSALPWVADRTSGIRGYLGSKFVGPLMKGINELYNKYDPATKVGALGKWLGKAVTPAGPNNHMFYGDVGGEALQAAGIEPQGDFGYDVDKLQSEESLKELKYALTNSLDYVTTNKDPETGEITPDWGGIMYSFAVGFTKFDLLNAAGSGLSSLRFLASAKAPMIAAKTAAKFPGKSDKIMQIGDALSAIFAYGNKDAQSALVARQAYEPGAITENVVKELTDTAAQSRKINEPVGIKLTRTFQGDVVAEEKAAQLAASKVKVKGAPKVKTPLRTAGPGGWSLDWRLWARTPQHFKDTMGTGTLTGFNLFLHNNPAKNADEFVNSLRQFGTALRDSPDSLTGLSGYMGSSLMDEARAATNMIFSKTRNVDGKIVSEVDDLAGVAANAAKKELKRIEDAEKARVAAGATQVASVTPEMAQGMALDEAKKAVQGRMASNIVDLSDELYGPDSVIPMGWLLRPMSKLYLGLNPKFAWRNLSNNVLTSAFDGWFSYKQPEVATEMLRRTYGFAPASMLRGVSPADIVGNMLQERATLLSSLKSGGTIGMSQFTEMWSSANISFAATGRWVKQNEGILIDALTRVGVPPTKAKAVSGMLLRNGTDEQIKALLADPGYFDEILGILADAKGDDKILASLVSSELFPSIAGSKSREELLGRLREIDNALKSYTAETADDVADYLARYRDQANAETLVHTLMGHFREVKNPENKAVVESMHRLWEQSYTDILLKASAEGKFAEVSERVVDDLMRMKPLMANLDSLYGLKRLPEDSGKILPPNFKQPEGLAKVPIIGSQDAQVKEIVRLMNNTRREFGLAELPENSILSLATTRPEKNLYALAQSSKMTESLMDDLAKGLNQPQMKVGPRKVGGAAKLAETKPLFPDGPPTYRGARQGWKLHLATDNPQDVSAWLKQKGYRHKVGKAGDQQGKDLTVYIGSRIDADRAAQEISTELSDVLKAPFGDTLQDDIELAPKVMGRFAIVSGTTNPSFASYGAKGFPYLYDDQMAVLEYLGHLGPGITTGKGMTGAEATRRADEQLRKMYGSYYTGIQEVAQAAPVVSENAPYVSRMAQLLRAKATAPRLLSDDAYKQYLQMKKMGDIDGAYALLESVAPEARTIIDDAKEQIMLYGNGKNEAIRQFAYSLKRAGIEDDFVETAFHQAASGDFVGAKQNLEKYMGELGITAVDDKAKAISMRNWEDAVIWASESGYTDAMGADLFLNSYDPNSGQFMGWGSYSPEFQTAVKNRAFQLALNERFPSVTPKSIITDFTSYDVAPDTAKLHSQLLGVAYGNDGFVTPLLIDTATRLRTRLTIQELIQATEKVPDEAWKPVKKVATGPKQAWQMARAEFEKQATLFHGTPVEIAKPTRPGGRIGGISYAVDRNVADGYALGSGNVIAAQLRDGANIIDATGNYANDLWHYPTQEQWTDLLRIAKKHKVDLSSGMYEVSPNNPLSFEAMVDAGTGAGGHGDLYKVFSDAGFDGIRLNEDKLAIAGDIYSRGGKSGPPPQIPTGETTVQAVVIFNPDVVQTHAEIIEQALMGGKSIPENVLAEYPDLLALAKKKGLVESTTTGGGIVTGGLAPDVVDTAVSEMNRFRAGAAVYATAMRDYSLHNYSATYMLDNYLRLFYMYPIWYTRTYPKWLMRFMNDPEIFRLYTMARGTVEDENEKNNMPLQYRGNIPVGPIALAMDQAFNPLYSLTSTYENEGMQQTGFGKFVDKISGGPGVWPMYTAANLATLPDVSGQFWSQFPFSGAVRTTSALLRETWPETFGGVPAGGFNVEELTAMPVNWLRRLGKKEGDIGERPNVKRQTAEVLWRWVNDGTITIEQADEAIAKRGGEIWDNAKNEAVSKRFLPETIGFFTGMNLYSVGDEERQINAAWNEYNQLMSMELEGEAWKQANAAFSKKYPFFYSYKTLYTSEESALKSWQTTMAYSKLAALGEVRDAALAKCAVGDTRCTEKAYEAFKTAQEKVKTDYNFEYIDSTHKDDEQKYREKLGTLYDPLLATAPVYAKNLTDEEVAAATKAGRKVYMDYSQYETVYAQWKASMPYLAEQVPIWQDYVKVLMAQNNWDAKTAWAQVKKLASWPMVQKYKDADDTVYTAVKNAYNENYYNKAMDAMYEDAAIPKTPTGTDIARWVKMRYGNRFTDQQILAAMPGGKNSILYYDHSWMIRDPQKWYESKLRGQFWDIRNEMDDTAYYKIRAKNPIVALVVNAEANDTATDEQWRLAIVALGGQPLAPPPNIKDVGEREPMEFPMYPTQGVDEATQAKIAMLEILRKFGAKPVARPNQLGGW